MKLEIVNPADWIPRVAELLAANWAETGFDFDFAPDVGAYQRLFDAGFCFAVRASNKSDDTIGYCTVTVVPHPHNPSVVVASNDALFIAPAHRRTTAAGRLIRFAETEAAQRGASRFTWHCRAGTSLSEMLIRHGYSPVDTVVMKGL